MFKLEIEYTDAQMKAMAWQLKETPQEWLQHAWEDKARRCMDRLINIHSKYQAKKMSDEERQAEILSLDPQPGAGHIELKT